MGSTQAAVQRLCRTLGLLPARGLWRDVRFGLAFTLGALAAALVAECAAPGNAGLVRASASFLFGFLLVQPLLEELMFRGVVQGWLRERAWGRTTVFGVSRANAVASLLFVAAHLPAQPLAWALAVSVPSVIFGYFRDRHGSLLPAVVLHVAYNAVFFLWPRAPFHFL
jgi:membrane protease YdiL (CAAX protease family)